MHVTVCEQKNTPPLFLGVGCWGRVTLPRRLTPTATNTYEPDTPSSQLELVSNVHINFATNDHNLTLTL